MQLKSSKGCRLAIGPYPYFLYDASGGGGKALLISTGENKTKYLRFCPKEFQVPPLNWKTTKFLYLPLPPGIQININMNKLEGTLNKISGEINLRFKARFTLEIFSVFTFPDLIISSLLNTGQEMTRFHKSEGLKLQKDGKTN